jgi:hypothetical protein
MQGHSPLEAGSGAGLAASFTGQTPLGAVLDAECEPVLRAGPLRQFVALLSTGRRSLLARDAEPLAQALGEHSQPGVGHVERVAPTIPQADHRFDRTVRRGGS